MAAHTPLPPSLRRGLAAFSSSLFTNNKTQDSGTPRTHHPGTAGAITPSAGCEAGTRSGQRDPGPGVLGSPAHPCPPCLAHEVLASLPLQMMLYFNVWYFPVWCLAEGTMLQLKAGKPELGGQSGQGWAPARVGAGRAWGAGHREQGTGHRGWLGQGCALFQYHLLPQHYQVLLVTAFLILSLAEGSRLYLGYVGNLQEKVPELAAFLLLSLLIQLPILLFLLTDSHIVHLPLEVAVHSLFLAFLLAEIVAAFLTLKTMTKQLAAQFYLWQLREGGRGWPGPRGTVGQAAEQG
ncbi:transmembrane protein 17B [Opisthocomus hoazin]|uniref:transmembrane protein 17B n=1 Tax=Opisthocomus hoazin TaxID=30419 RepID=UPI003F53874D